MQHSTDVGGVHWVRQTAEPTRDWSIMQSPNGSLIRFELRKGERAVFDPPDRERAELIGENYHSTFGRSTWLAFSMCFSPGPPSSSPVVMGQFHATEDARDAKMPPVLAQYVVGSTFDIFSQYDESAETTPATAKVVHQYSEPRAAAGVWHSFVYDVIFDPFGRGALRVWRDGHKVVNYHGPLGFNDAVGPYFKIGIYRAVSDATTVVQFANLELGDRNLSERISRALPLPDLPSDVVAIGTGQQHIRPAFCTAPSW